MSTFSQTYVRKYRMNPFFHARPTFENFTGSRSSFGVGVWGSTPAIEHVAMFKTGIRNMLNFLQKRWFLISLVVLISSGIFVGMNLSSEGVGAISFVIKPRIITAVVLFLMSFSLDSKQLRSSFRSPGPVIWASMINYGFIPLLAWPLMQLQLIDDFKFGLMIAASVPCTLAAASVWTRKAGGNDAVSLLVTLVTNAACFVMAPFWLNLVTTQNIALSGRDMVIRLLQAVLIPTLAGQALRLLPAAARLATRYKTPIGVVAQSCILTLVFSAACNAGIQLNRNDSGVGPGAIAVVWGTCIAIHLVAMAIGFRGGRALGFSRADCVAVAFASSQKTLPIGVLLATDPTMFGNPALLDGHGIPFAVFPMLMYHASQLFIDTAVADRFAKKAELIADD